MLTMTELKEYARIDADESYLQTMLSAAISFFRNKGVIEEKLNEDDKQMMNLGLMMLITHWYDNRVVITENHKTTKIPFGVDSILFDLKLKCLRVV